jgi:hypothetical protein
LNSGDLEPFLNELLDLGASGLWAALEIILMYLHPAKEPDGPLTTIVKRIILAPNLFELVNRPGGDGHHLEEAVALLAKYSKLDSTFITKLAARLMTLSGVEESDIFFDLDEPVRKILAGLVKDFPTEVWTSVAPFLVVPDSMQRHRVQQLVGVGHDDHLSLSALGGLPSEAYLGWVRENPEERARTVMSWLPLVRKDDDGSLSWYPGFEAFVAEFGSIPSVLDEVAIRLHPTSWWGSVVPHVELWMPLLEQWRTHPIVEVRAWAQRKIDALTNYIAAQRKRDEESEVR